MKTFYLIPALMPACAAIALSSGTSFAKGTVTAKAYLSDKAPNNCNFVETEDTQQTCTHNACKAAVKNAIRDLQNQQPSNDCKKQAKSRGCTYSNCK